MSQRETERIVRPMEVMFESQGWHVHNIHGNAFSSGLPDKYIVHKTGKYSPRWIEFKVKDQYGAFSITPAQQKIFPILVMGKAPVWVIADVDLRGEEMYHRRVAWYKHVLTKPSNLHLSLVRETQKLIGV